MTTNLHSEAMPPIVFAIDTSGSMDSRSLEVLWAEVREAVAEVNPQHVTVIQCDSRIQSVDHYDPMALPSELTVTGRGGTAFTPVFEEVADLGPRPACLIYMTDLLCHEYPSEPDYPVLWAAAGAGQAPSPPFGERIDIGPP